MRDQLQRQGALVAGHGTHGDGGEQLAADLSQPSAAEALWQAVLDQAELFEIEGAAVAGM